MRRSIRITLLALGTVLGYGFAIHSVRHHHYRHGDDWERHIADVCVRAAESAKGQKEVPKPASPEP